MFGDNKKENPNEGKEKGYAYRCKVKCTYNGRLCREGDIIVLPEKKEVPHFEFAEKAQ